LYLKRSELPVKLKQLKFSISPLFLVFGAFLFYFQFGSLFAAYLLAILLHELGHALVAKKLGYQLNAIKLMPYGTQLSIQNQINSVKDDLLISLAGPAVNLVLIVLTLALWWLFPIIYVYTELFVVANIISLLFNLLPVFPLDGGRVALTLLSRKIKRERAYKIMQTFGAVSAILFFLLFLISFFYRLNTTFFIISFFLMESSLSKNKTILYQTIFILNAKKTIKKPRQVRHLVLPNETTLIAAAKLVQPHYYTVFYVLDDEQNIMRTVTQKQLQQCLLNQTKNATLKQM
jgi:stage IV sporulation protein FB